MKNDNKQNEQKEENILTSNQGVKISDNDNSLKAGIRGGTLMDDFHFREKMTHFDHERIPERVVHARGSGAYGVFKIYDDSLKQYTRAKFLTDPTAETKVFVRFSTVVGFRGSADTVRDVRGFATKFYTSEGNYDLVGNNMPVFFIQDGIKFPDLVHSIKPEPHNEMPQASAAHDNFWDFISLTPESMNMIMWVLSDRALPARYSMMEGFGVHTFRLVNENGEGTFVKFHWKPVLGVHSITWDETQKIAGKDPDFNRRDLWDSIEAGNFPEFEFGVQLLPEKDEFKFDFDILDATKIWPEELIPVKIIGKMTLNRNPDNFFAETEQVAFHPGHVVPGIDFTNDPLLQGRLFSYIDTQLTRLGGPNFAQIPINRPEVKVNNNQQDGFMRHENNKGKVNYSPNSLAGGCPMHAGADPGAFKHYMERIDGKKIKERSETFSDHYSQATLFWNSMTEPEKQHIIEAFHFELGKVQTIAVRERMMEHLVRVDRKLAEEVSKGIAVPVPAISRNEKVSKPAGKISADRSEALSQMNTRKDTIKGRKIAILLAEGFDSTQLEEAKKTFKKNGASFEIISKYHGQLKGATGGEVKVDKPFVTTSSVLYDALYIPGGTGHIEALSKQGDAILFLKETYKHCKAIGLSGEASDLLKVAGLSADDAGIVQSKGQADSDAFIMSLVKAIAQHRHWEREKKKDEIAA